MKTLNTQSAGWLVAGALAAIVAFSGFQPKAEKSGIVDLNRVIQQSEFGKASTNTLNSQLAVRRGLIDFVQTYKVLTTEQAQRLRELSLKANQTEADKAEIEKIKADVMASDKRRSELSQKQNLTDADRSVLSDFSNRVQTMGAVLERWNAEFTDELNTLEGQARQTTVDRAKASLQEVAKSQGFTVVYEATVAPYGANDLTEDTIKSMNAKK